MWLGCSKVTLDVHVMQPRTNDSSHASMQGEVPPLPLLLNAPSSATNALVHSLPSCWRTVPAATYISRACTHMLAMTPALTSVNKKQRRRARAAIPRLRVGRTAPWDNASMWMFKADELAGATLERTRVCAAAQSAGVTVGGLCCEAEENTALRRPRDLRER